MSQEVQQVGVVRCGLRPGGRGPEVMRTSGCASARVMQDVGTFYLPWLQGTPVLLPVVVGQTWFTRIRGEPGFPCVLNKVTYVFPSGQ